MERKWLSKGYRPQREGNIRHEKKVNEQGALTIWRPQGGTSGYAKNANE